MYIYRKIKNIVSIRINSPNVLRELSQFKKYLVTKKYAQICLKFYQLFAKEKETIGQIGELWNHLKKTSQR